MFCSHWRAPSMEVEVYPVRMDGRTCDTVVHFLGRPGVCKTFDIIYRVHENINRGGRKQQCRRTGQQIQQGGEVKKPSPTTDRGQPSKLGQNCESRRTTSRSSCLASGTLGAFLFASNCAASCPRLGLEDCVPRDCSFRS